MQVEYGSNEHEPITWFKRIPVYVTTIMVAAFACGVLLTSILLAARVPMEVFLLSYVGLTSGFIWQPFTCSLFDIPNFFTLFGLCFIYMAGTSVERHIGRGHYLKLLALLLVITPVLVILITRVVGFQGMHGGTYELLIALFIAFATLYPNVGLLAGIPAKWMAIAGFVLALMTYLPSREWFKITMMFAMAGVAHAYIRLWILGKIPELSIPNPFIRRPNIRVVPDARSTSNSADDDILLDIDPLLEKISKHGIGSLTPKERAALDRARTNLLKKKGNS